MDQSFFVIVRGSFSRLSATCTSRSEISRSGVTSGEKSILMFSGA